MKIGIDIDGTLTKTFEKWAEELRKEGFNVSYKDFTEDEFLSNLGGKTIKEEDVKIWYLQNRGRMRQEYSLYPGVRIILSLLAEHELYAITSRDAWEEKPDPSTQEWADKNKFPFKKIFYTTDKAGKCRELGVQVMIEDYVTQARRIAQKGIPVLLFDKHYNKGPENPLITRFSHWAEVPKLLKKVQRSKAFNAGNS